MNLSAEAWCLFDLDHQKIVHGKFPHHKREIASLTKMMTFAVSWSLMQRYHPELTTIDLKVKKYCTKVGGTSANLRKNDSLSLGHLWYALLLPSGNDAAMVLADYFGALGLAQA